MQVIEKVKVVPEGYNGAGMNYDGGNRRDVNGKANAGLTLGIIGTALGAWALFGNRRSAGASILGGAGGGMLGDDSILGGSDPLLYPSEKMTNSIDEQIAFLQSQKQAINEAYRRNAIPNANNGTTQNQQVPTQGIWDAIDAEIAPLTQEQQNMLLSNQDYVNNYNALQSMVQAEVLNLVRGKIEASADGKHLLEEQLKLVKLLKSKIVEFPFLFI